MASINLGCLARVLNSGVANDGWRNRSCGCLEAADSIRFVAFTASLDRQLIAISGSRLQQEPAG